MYWFTYILSDKDTLYNLLPTILWKTRSSRPQLFRGTAVLKIIEDFQKIAGGGIRFR